MTKSYFPFDAGAGANVIEAQWAKMARLFCPSGVAQGQLNQLETYADNTGMQVKVKSGQCFVEGFFFESDAEETLSISAANPSNPRIDRVVVRLDRTANTIDLAVVAGTPAGSPSAPALTQTASTWEIALAQVAVAAGDTSIAAGDVTDERWFTMNWSTQYLPVTVTKAADESVTSDTVLQDDNDFSFTALAGTIYVLEFFLKLYSASSTPDFKWDISSPSGSTESIQEGATPVALTLVTELPYYIRAIVFISSTSGTVKLQWAQDTSSGTATTVRAGSTMKYTRIK